MGVCGAEGGGEEVREEDEFVAGVVRWEREREGGLRGRGEGLDEGVGAGSVVEKYALKIPGCAGGGVLKPDVQICPRESGAQTGEKSDAGVEVGLVAQVLENGFQDLIDWARFSAVGEWGRGRGAAAEILAVSVREEDLQDDVDCCEDGVFPERSFGCRANYVDEIDRDGFIGFVGQLDGIPDAGDALVGQVPGLAVQFGV